MADQMREARRRRILENSEKRLQRILGASTNEEVLQEPSVMQTESPTKLSQHLNDEVLKVTESGGNSSQQQTFPRQRSGFNDTIPEANIQPTNFKGMGKSLFELDEVKNVHENKIIQEQPKNVATLLVFIAITSITLLFTNFGILIGHNVLIPFGIFETYIFLTTKRNESPTTSLITTALMLSGLPQHTLNRITKTVRSFHTVIQDLCVYLFACFLCYQIYSNTF